MRAKGKYIKSLKVYLLVSMTSEHPQMNTYVSCGLPQCRFHVGINVFIWLHNEAFIYILRALNRYGKGNNDIQPSPSLFAGVRFLRAPAKRESPRIIDRFLPKKFIV